MRKLIVAVDFDGTIVENKWPKIGNPIQNCLEILRLMQKEFQLILWTCRTGNSLQEAIVFLKSNGITDFLVNQNISNLGFETSNKIYADVYIDDKNLFPIDWQKIYVKIKELPNVEIRTK